MSETLHFLLVPDASAGRRVRRAVAEGGARLNVVVGTWTDLAARTRDAFLVLEPDTGWEESVREAVAATPAAFWTRSCQTDPEGTIGEVRGMFLSLLRGLGPGKTLARRDIPGLSPRGRRHFADLVDLSSRLGDRLPDDLERLRRILEAPADRLIRPIRVYRLPELPDLSPWQRALLEKLDVCLAGDPDPVLQSTLERSLAAPSLADGCSALAHLQRRLFSTEGRPVPPDASLQWIGARDELEEVEMAAGMIQGMLDADPSLRPAQVGLLLDGSRFRDWACAEVFRRAGLPLSGLRPSDDERNLGGEAVFNFLATRRRPAPAMALASLYASPLMPWPAVTGNRLASNVMAGDFDAQPASPLPRPARRMLTLIREEPGTPPDLLRQLRSFSEGLSTDERLAGHTLVARTTLLQVTGILEKVLPGSEIPWPEILRSVPQAPQPTGQPEEPTREGVAVMYEDEEPWRPVRVLLILGFAEGHFPAGARSSPVFDRADLAAIRDRGEIDLLTEDDVIVRNRERFRRQLCMASDRCLFFTPLKDLAGKPRSVSGSAAFMVRLLEGVDTPEALLRVPERERDRMKITGLALAPPAVGIPPRESDLSDPDLGRDLLTDRDGQARTESPTRLERMLVSPLAWLLQRLDALPRDWAPEQSDPRTGGSIAHEVFEHLFSPGKPLPSAAEIDQAVPTLFSRALLMHAPFLNRAEWSVERRKLEADIGQAAEAWRDILQAAGARVAGAELTLEGEFAGVPVKGRADLVLELPDGQLFVVDYKKSGSRRRRKAMESGYDLQATLYRRMLQTGGAGSRDVGPITEKNHSGNPPGLLYYLMDSREGLADRSIDHPDIKIVEGNLSGRAEGELQERIEELRHGMLRLNRAADLTRFDQAGVGLYCLQDSPLIARFTLPEDEAAGGEPS